MKRKMTRLQSSLIDLMLGEVQNVHDFIYLDFSEVALPEIYRFSHPRHVFIPLDTKVYFIQMTVNRRFFHILWTILEPMFRSVSRPK